MMVDLAMSTTAGHACAQKVPPTPRHREPTNGLGPSRIYAALAHPAT